MTKRSNALKNLLLIIASFLVLYGANATELPQDDNKVHLGVASCAASMCHGSVNSRQVSDVLQNEYIVWSREDAHSQAYQTLLTAESKSIAKKLGLKNAETASICLDCHSDNVKPEYRGDQFQISDGVSCESCHGGGADYISSHTNTSIHRDVNLSKGLYPTDDAQSRAKLCLSCHLGNSDKQATHDIMGAGHPRLAFELDTFTILQPLHYVLDDDYKKNKWFADSYVTWVYGQLEASRATLQLIESNLIDNTSLFPELSLFDCHSCHHPMSDLKWTQAKGQGFKPGAVRLNDGNLKMLLVIASSAGEDKSLHLHLTSMSQGLNDKQQLLSSVAQINRVIESIQKVLAEQSPSVRKNAAKHTLRQILSMGAKGQFSDYIAAEQAVMATDLLLDYLDQKDTFSKELEMLFKIVAQEEKYIASELSQKLGLINSELAIL